MNILVSAYSCNPYGVSESFAAFNWLQILVKKYSITLMTTEDNRENIIKFYGNMYPEKLKIIPISDQYPMKKNKLIHESFKVGYFLFNRKMYKYLKNNMSIVDSSDVLFHKSPSGFRYFSYLHKFNKPFVFGPTGGGLQVPDRLKDYFKKEHPIFSLRKLDPFLLNRKIYQDNFNKAKYILITLGYVRNILGNKYKNKYYELFDTGIDTNFNRRETKINLNKPIRILYVGKLTRYKGAELLLNAIEKIDNMDFIVDIVGDGEEREYLEILTKKCGIEDKVVFHGFISDKATIKMFYENASIFCFPTLTEASGNSLLEAMSFSLPIVSINNGGPKYMCPDGGTYKIDINESKKMEQDIASSLKELLNHPNKIKSMGDINRNHCVANYDWNVLETRIYDFFDSLDEDNK